METTTTTALTLIDLLRRIAAHKRLEFNEEASAACSKPIKEYVLNEKLLAVLAEHNISQQAHPDCGDKLFTLVDKNPQKMVPGWSPSNYWNFNLIERGGGTFDLRVRLSVGFTLNLEERGIALVPKAHGPFVSAADQLPNLRMFKALVDNDNDAPAVAKELATNDDPVVVTWTDLGLGGIRRLSDLFSEFSCGDQSVMRVGRSGKVFDPNPYPHLKQPSDELFIPEPAQPKIFAAWRTQLNEYRSSLVA